MNTHTDRVERNNWR